MAPHSALLLACALLCLVQAAPRADTLDVIGVMVEFQQDDPSDLTTGTGKFDSGDNFKLDPKKHDRIYFERHLEFARNFFQTASSRKLVVRYAVVDQRDGRFDHLTLPHPMRHYRVPEKKPEDSTVTYIRQLNQGIMAFAGDALRLLSAKGVLNNGFTALGPVDTVTQTRDTLRVRPGRTVFMVFHAGASGLIDGGGMGPIFANTQSDLIDSYIWPDDFRDYQGMDYFDGASTVRLEYDRDTAHADQRGVYSEDSTNFVQQLLTCSETAGQDGLEFGVNGIVVNQIARALGLPDLWDTQKGESAVGGYCLLDVGGYNSVNGFVPVLPSAWCRVFKKWSGIKVAEPDSNFEWTGTLPSFLSGDTVIKVPLSSTEYYLIENRQITPFSDKKFSLYTPDKTYDYGTPYDTNYGFWARALLDSLCEDPSKCDRLKVNPDRATGVVTASSSYDIGLPGYGALIWHVDESVIRDKFARNGINDYINRRGVDLEEADGIEDLGAEYVDIFGQRTQAYGGPADFFPHYEAARSKYVNQMTPFNAGTAHSNTDRYFSTHTNTGAYTGVTVTIDTIQGLNAMTEYMDLVPYEKIRLYAADSFRIRVSWMLSQGRWPQATDTLAPITDPVAVDSTLYGVNDSGLVFVFGARGGLLRTDSTLYRAGYRKLSAPSVRNRSLYFSAGEPGASDSLVVLQYEPESLRITPVKSLHGDTLSTPITALPGGILIFGTAEGRLYKAVSGMSLAMVLDSTRPVSAVAADSQSVWALSGRTLRRYSIGLVQQMIGEIPGFSGNNSRLAIADFYPDRPGLEIFCNDDQGNAVLVNAALLPLPGWPVKVTATSAMAPSVGDVDGDGYLDIVIPGDNTVHVLSRNGTALTGWPYTASRREPLGQLTSAISLSDIDNDNAQELFVPRPDGNLAILDNNGRIYEFTAGARVMGRSLSFGGLPGASCVLADLDTDARPGVPEHLEIFLSNRAGALSCFNVPMAGTVPRSAWSTLGGTLGRTFVYQGPAPVSRTVSGSLKVDTLFTYPNPARNVNSITIKYRLGKAAARVTAKLFNAAGDRILTRSGLPGDLFWNHASLDISKLAPGLYSLKLEAESGSGSGKAFKFTKVGVLK